MQRFGETCMMTNCDDLHHAKLANQGTTRSWMGFTDEHPVGTYPVLNLKNQKISLTKYMTFLNKSYDEWDKVDKSVIVLINYEGSNDEENEMIPENNTSNNYYSLVSDCGSDDKEEKEEENLLSKNLKT